MLNPALLLLLFPVLIAAFVVFDRLVRLEYSSYRQHWEADGKPHGFFWVPAEAKLAGGWLVSLASWRARNRLSFGWLFSTPGWMRRDEKALRLIFWLRVLVLTWNVGIIAPLLAFLLLGWSEI
jgi:hypothetical protein